MSLTEVLPTEPVTPTTLAPSARRQARRQRLQRRQAGRPRRRPRPPRAEFAFLPASGDKHELSAGPTTTPQAPASIAAGANSPPSTRSPRRPKKRSPSPLARGVDRRPRAASRARPRRRSRRPSPRRSAPRPGSSPVRSSSPPPSAAAPRGRPRGRRRGSCGRPRIPGPARGPCRRSPRCRRARRASKASAIAARRSGSDSTPAPSPVPARTSAMIASGSSERGLSEVTIARSEPLGAGPAHLRPLVAVAVAAGAEDRDHPALGQPPGGAEDVVERVGRVGVVDEHGEVLALVDRLEAAGHPPRLGQPGRRLARARLRARSPRRRRRARWRR